MPPLLKFQASARALALALCLCAISACSAPDGKALKKLACEQAAASLDLQSLSQLDSLRKALGVARDVDPILACKALGANMGPAQQAPNGSETESESQSQSQSESQSESQSQSQSEAEAN
jgi:hypothetical protein